MSHPQKPAPHALVTRTDFEAEGVGSGPPRAGMGLDGGRFVLLELIGEGGNGTVWKARDRELRSAVAVKLLRSTEPDRQRRFSREAEVLANIAHPGVARSLARGITHEGQPFMALELCRGQSLAAHLVSGPLPWRDAVHIGILVAAALDAFHARGVIHRDVKPGNIMLWNDDAEGLVVKLIDLGVAHVGAEWDRMGDASATPAPPRHQTELGIAIGTPGYMPLEAGLGPPHPCFDVFSLAATIFHACTGRLPEGEPELFAALMPGCEAAEDLGRVLAAAMALEPEDRTQTAREFGRALAAVQASHPERTQSPLLDGRYERVAVLGTGARADVYAVTHRGSSHDLALKLLRSTDPDDGLRFRREATLLAAFDHPGVPRYFDYAPAADPPYIAMARARGVPAVTFCSRDEAGRLSPLEVAQVGWEAAQTLAYVHEQGVIHRDINANNVMLELQAMPGVNSTGRVKLPRAVRVTLIDFGNAELTDKFYSTNSSRYLTPPESRVAIPDGGIHTLGWAAPEARAGRGYTAKSDVYSLGVLLYRLLTGKLPTIKAGEPVSPVVHAPACPNDVAVAVLCALNVDPTQRPTAAQLASYFADALTEDEVLDDEAAAEVAKEASPARPTVLTLVPPARPPANSPNSAKGWTRFFEAMADDEQPASVIALDPGSAKILPLHRPSAPRPVADVAPPVTTETGTGAPKARRWRPAWAIAAAAFAGILVVAARWIGGEETADIPIASTDLKQEPSPPAHSQPDPILATPAVLADPESGPSAPDGTPADRLAAAATVLKGCAHEAGHEVLVELTASVGEPRFTQITIVSADDAGAACARRELEQIRFAPPTSASALVKSYQP
jgi:serine/threonine protein kinase